MANHLRKQIRDAVTTQLTGLATTGLNVFKTRGYELGDEELPAIIVLAEQENATASSMQYPRLLSRELMLTVTAYVKATTALDDTLDQICKEVEIKLSSQIGLGGLTKDLILEQTSIDMDVDAEAQRGVARMYWKATYYTTETTPDVAI